ncbi:MAG: DUF1080 domain-containing protein [Planctomyces sp.]|nr:DUF1080 domain-containing protein [Planctomyces sp.]
MIRALVVFTALVGLSGPAGAEESRTVLFDGQTLEGWTGSPDVWSVQDGAITGTVTDDRPLEHNTFLIWQGGEPANFQLRLKYKMVGNNSGIQYRSRVHDAERFIVGGYQADIDASLQFTGINYEERGRGILAERGQSVTIRADGTKSIVQFADAGELGKLVRKEDWNDYLVVAEGIRVQHFINGVLMSEVIDEQSDKAATSGVIALQAHTGPAMVIQFKDIFLLENK